MAKPKVYIDGQSGTTGLQIQERIASRNDLELLRIEESLRHDVAERERLINEADVVFLCLPDEAAREAVSLVHNPKTRVIDASTAHRCAEGWTYGFPELEPGQRAAIAHSHRIANPGCHATGFIACTAPLVRAGLLPADSSPVCCYSITGYTGGGKRMIASYEAKERPTALNAPGIYGLTLCHKHLPEMMLRAGLTQPPIFTPVVADYPLGMATTVMLANRQLVGAPHARDVRECLAAHYAGEPLVSVEAFGANGPTLYANDMAGTDRLKIVVCGNEENTIVTALFDNLGKGASGAAVQNMNIALGLTETLGLR